MKYTVKATPRFDKEFKKLDRYTMKMIKSWITKNLEGCENPRAKGKGLASNRSGCRGRCRTHDVCARFPSPLLMAASMPPF